MEQLLSGLDVIGIDSAAARIFDKLRSTGKLRKSGRADLLIASIVLAHQATLVTRNLRDFRLVPGLNLVNWVD
ncbi:MAG TPA: type II toxin-antitoxin system VapC family toxin [Pirellulaceae bacterium]|nr:type II toxin-antitoxin system VapC family toxin [Pirellulaceae bacterium]